MSCCLRSSFTHKRKGPIKPYRFSAQPIAGAGGAFDYTVEPRATRLKSDMTQSYMLVQYCAVFFSNARGKAVC